MWFVCFFFLLEGGLLKIIFSINFVNLRNSKMFVARKGNNSLLPMLHVCHSLIELAGTKTIECQLPFYSPKNMRTLLIR